MWLDNILAFNFVSDGKLMVSRNNHHTDQIDYEETLVHAINCAEKICSEKLKLESIHTPIKHKPDLRHIEQKS